MEQGRVGSLAARVGLIAGISASGMVGLPSSAGAADYCDPGLSYRVASHSASFRPAKNSSFKDGPGGTMRVSVTTASTLSGTFGTTVESEINAIFTSVKAQVNASVTKSRTVTVGHEYSQKITRGKYGHMQYGSWGTVANWEQIFTFSNCAQRVEKRGTAKLPGKELGWKYSETSY